MPEELKRTKKDLADALRQLLAKKPLDQIRVREVTELCGIRRQSFYYHFTDVGQLFDWALEQERAGLTARQEKCLTWQQAVADLLAYTAENRAFYLSVLKNRGRAGLRQVLGGAVENFLRSALTYYQERSGTPPNPAAEQARLLWWRTMVLTLLEDWLGGNLCQPPEEVIDLLEQDLRDGMAGAAWRSLARSDTME